MRLSQEKYDVVIIGGGIAGNALATVLARTGRAVLVLERSTVYRDKVRGEVFHAWGVAEAQRLGIYETLMRSGGIHHSPFVPHDETVEAAEAEAAALPLDSLLPGVPGTLGVRHPWACEALSRAAIAVGARVLRGVESAEVLRFCNAVATTLRGEFGPEARERRRRAQRLMQIEPALGLWRRAYLAGPESVPASAFDASIYHQLCARAVGAGS